MDAVVAFPASFLFGEDAFAFESAYHIHFQIFLFFIRTPVETPNTQQILRKKNKKKNLQLSPLFVAQC